MSGKACGVGISTCGVGTKAIRIWSNTFDRGRAPRPRGRRANHGQGRGAARTGGGRRGAGASDAGGGGTRLPAPATRGAGAYNARGERRWRPPAAPRGERGARVRAGKWANGQMPYGWAGGGHGRLGLPRPKHEQPPPEPGRQMAGFVRLHGTFGPGATGAAGKRQRMCVNVCVCVYVCACMAWAARGYCGRTGARLPAIFTTAAPKKAGGAPERPPPGRRRHRQAGPRAQGLERHLEATRERSWWVRMCSTPPRDAHTHRTHVCQCFRFLRAACPGLRIFSDDWGRRRAASRNSARGGAAAAPVAPPAG
jgi:hypothetical protein